MRKLSNIISILLILTFIAPTLVDAKAGSGYRGGSSYRGGQGGGFGTRPYQGGGYNYRPQPSYTTPYSTPRSGAYARPSSSGSFLSGLASGVLGAWLYSKFFPSAAPITPGQENKNINTSQSAVSEKQGGGFLRIILTLLVAYIVWRILRRRRNNNQNQNQQNISNNENTAPRQMSLKDYINLAKGSAAPAMGSTLSQRDQQEFENLLVNIQNAWSQYNTSVLQQLTTPAMFENFSRTIQDNQQQGIRNYISNVRLINMNVIDSWQENNNEFARVSLTWNAIDFAVNESLPPSDPNYLVDGNQNEPVTNTEIWTLARYNNGPWTLADIAQA